ncbi:hypothetical protein [Dolichospermum compactum]|uniref:Uncharacterized protein n=1 Tax=Dolichospermum compactum NIES-806 TaxID=1973481 RepID=A0A1Z4V0L7_9CYAN|nr:hypothetical protein [Dolichospermum compactum]BAZ85062.1 hypothetical protein NIES806_12620 [Dolichospermum compactum NIES-806]
MNQINLLRDTLKPHLEWHGARLSFLAYLPHPKLSHNENWSFGDLVLAIAYQYFLVLVQNTTLNGDKNQKKPIVTPGGAECGL